MHEGHRARLRNKFLKYGTESLEKHELLELYLTYSIPRKNTNEIAHSLLNKFNTFDDLFGADADEIVKVKGVGDKSVLLIKLFNKIYNLMAPKSSEKHKILSIHNIYDYIRENSHEYKNKTVNILYINNRTEIVSQRVLTSNKEILARSIPDILRELIRLEIKYVILVEKIENISSKSILNENYLKQFGYYFSLINIEIVEALCIYKNRLRSLLRK